MENELKNIENQLAIRIYKLFIAKYDGNKSAFAKDVSCNEATIRRIFRNDQGITINLLFRIANALDITVAELLKGLKINNK